MKNINKFNIIMSILIGYFNILNLFSVMEVNYDKVTVAGNSYNLR